MHSIRLKTSLFVSLVLAASLVVVVTAAALFTHSRTRAMIESEVRSTVERHADLVSARIGAARATARSIAALAEAQRAIGRPDREKLMQQLKVLLDAEPGLFGTWIVFRPNAFDGRDRIYAGLPGHDRNGMINFYFVRNESGKAELNLYDVTTDQSDQLERDWFKVAHDSGREAIIEPYLETFDGGQGDHSVMMTSAAVPVRSDEGTVLGVAGVDLTLADLQAMVAPLRIAGAGHAAIVSGQGIVAAHPEAQKLGIGIVEAGYPDLIRRAVSEGRQAEVVGEFFGEEQFIFALPVNFGIPGQSWSFVFSVPVAALTETSRDLWRGLAILGALLLAVAGVAGAWAGSKVASPIRLMTGAMRSIAQGDLDIAIPGSESRDEISQMARALEVFRDTARERARLQSTMVDLQSHNRAVESLNTELRHQNERFDAALTNMNQGLCMIDADNRVTVVNANYMNLFGLRASPVGRDYKDLVREVLITAGVSGDRLAETLGSIEARALQRRGGLLNQAMPDGRVIEITFNPLAGGGWVNTFEDVTEQRRAEERLAHLARHDSLTDLANRLVLEERLGEVLARQLSFAVFYIDLDRFKPVNDTLGHHVGDALIKAAASRIVAETAPGDLVARFGGDEFGIVQVGATPTAAAELAGRLIATLSRSFQIEGNKISIGASIGIAVAGEGDDVAELLKEADLALYRAKANGRGGYCFFEPSMDESVRLRRLLEIDLRAALERQDLDVHYQPIVSSQDKRIVACEALVRWNHPERGMVPPSVFVPIAEETGLINALGSWVLQRACMDALGWPDDVKVTVNISAAQFCGADIPALVRETLEETGLPGRRLELEITESVLMQSVDSIQSVIDRLAAMGVSISMDDFGTGYSSLAYLRRFSFGKIKIDRSFVTDLAGSAEAQAIVAAVVNIASVLGMETTAEGVETEEQFLLLKAAGCSQAQGYLFSRPIPAGQLAFGMSQKRLAGLSR